MRWGDHAYAIAQVLIVAAVAVLLIVAADNCSDRQAHREQHRMTEP
jgi:hypothetical protein